MMAKIPKMLDLVGNDKPDDDGCYTFTVRVCLFVCVCVGRWVGCIHIHVHYVCMGVYMYVYVCECVCVYVCEYSWDCVMSCFSLTSVQN